MKLKKYKRYLKYLRNEVYGTHSEQKLENNLTYAEKRIEEVEQEIDILIKDLKTLMHNVHWRVEGEGHLAATFNVYSKEN